MAPRAIAAPRADQAEELSGYSDGKRCEENRSEGQEQDRAQVELEGWPVGAIGARLKQGWEKQY
jgi:hypothetical protein